MLNSGVQSGSGVLKGWPAGVQDLPCQLLGWAAGVPRRSGVWATGVHNGVSCMGGVTSLGQVYGSGAQLGCRRGQGVSLWSAGV